MKKMRLILSVLSFTLISFLHSNLFAQVVESRSISTYALEVIETLTSDEFEGRGYVNDGMKKSAEYIAEEFEKLGLDPIDGSYFQAFEMPINIIKNAELTLNGEELNYGIDFIVRPNSTSQNFIKNDIYLFDPIDFSQSLINQERFIEFIKKDMINQKNKHIVFPPIHFEIDSLNQYYKNWPTVYKADENNNRSIFFFTADKLNSSLSLFEDNVTQFFINKKFYSEDLSIDYYKIDSEFVEDFKVHNVIGQIKGENSDSIIVITAHYDHLGRVGDTIFRGASDNASGTAFILDLAKHFTQYKPKFNLVFIAFAAEEAGLMGSTYFVENPLIKLDEIKFLLNFDIMGAGEDGIQIVNSSIFIKEYELLNKINENKNLIKEIKKRGEACNSDHCPFYRKGVPSFFTYTLGGPGFYHDPLDTLESLNLYGFENLKKLFIHFIEEL